MAVPVSVGRGRPAQFRSHDCPLPVVAQAMHTPYDTVPGWDTKKPCPGYYSGDAKVLLPPVSRLFSSRSRVTLHATSSHYCVVMRGMQLILRWLPDLTVIFVASCCCRMAAAVVMLLGCLPVR